MGCLGAIEVDAGKIARERLVLQVNAVIAPQFWLRARVFGLLLRLISPICPVPVVVTLDDAQAE